MINRRQNMCLGSTLAIPRSSEGEMTQKHLPAKHFFTTFSSHFSTDPTVLTFHTQCHGGMRDEILHTNQYHLQEQQKQKNNDEALSTFEKITNLKPLEALQSLPPTSNNVSSSLPQNLKKTVCSGSWTTCPPLSNIPTRRCAPKGLFNCRLN